MRKAKRIIWILNGVLFTVLVLFGVSYLITNSKGVFGGKGGQSNAELQKGEIISEVSEEELSIDTPEPEPEKTTTTIAIGGDAMLKESLQKKYDTKGESALISSEVKSILEDADIAMLNEEFPFCIDGEPSSDNYNTYRVDPQYASFFNDIGIDIVSLANNHSLDYGKEALVESCATLEDANIKYVGAGANIDRAKEVQYIEVNGYKIAFVAASRVVPESTWNATDTNAGILSAYDTSVVSEQITEAKQNADYVIVYLHWGIEYKSEPESFQRNMAKEFINAGADAIIGSHTHCLQGIEFYKDCPIVYSLGDLFFDTSSKRTAVITLTLTDEEECRLKIYPCFTSNGKTDLVTRKSSVSNFYEHMDAISFNAVIDSEGNVTKTVE